MKTIINQLDEAFDHFKIVKTDNLYKITAFIARKDCEDYEEYSGNNESLDQAILDILEAKSKGQSQWAARMAISTL